MIKVYDLKEGSVSVKKVMTVAEDIFIKARDFYHAHPEMDEDPITILGEDGTALYQLGYVTNQGGSEFVVRTRMGLNSDFLAYTYEDTDLDLTMLKRAECFLFDQIDEYSYAIARIILREFPESRIYFTDTKAAWFFSQQDRVKIISEEEGRKQKEENAGRLMTILQDGSLIINRENIESMTYNSQQVMNGLYWLTEKVSYGEENPDKTFVLIKSHLGHEGIAGVLRYVLNKLEVIRATGRDLEPVVDLGIFGEINQFCRGTGADVWSMYFEPVSRYSVRDVYNSKNVLLPYDGMKTKNPYLYEQDILSDYPGLIRKYLRFKKETLAYCEEQLKKIIPGDVKRYIGVVGRGTDYNMQLSGALSNYLMRPLTGADILKKTEELFDAGAYDGIFLATEDEQVFDLFMKSNLKDRIFYVEQERISYNPEDTSRRFLADYYKEETNRDGYSENLRYISIIYILSRASALLSTTLCGAAKIAWGLSEDGFEHVDVPGLQTSPRSTL